MSGTIIHVGPAPPLPEGPALFFDGTSARARNVRVVVDDTAGVLEITSDGAPIIGWTLADVRRLPDQASVTPVILVPPDNGRARLQISDGDLLRALSARAPRLNKPPRTSGGVTRLFSAFAAIAVAVAAVLILAPLCNHLGTRLSDGAKAALGAQTFTRFTLSASVCERPEGRAALETLVAPLGVAVADVVVLDAPHRSAAALADGRIVLFRGLIDTLEHDAELAAVLAHELGHLAAGDPMKASLESATALALPHNPSHHRTGIREARADAFAAARLQAAGYGPAALEAAYANSLGDAKRSNDPLLASVKAICRL